MSRHQEDWTENDRESISMLLNHPIKLHWMMTIESLKEAKRSFKLMVFLLVMDLKTK